MKVHFQSDLEPRGKSSSRDIKRDSCRSQDEEMNPSPLSAVTNCTEMAHQSPASCRPAGRGGDLSF